MNAALSAPSPTDLLRAAMAANRRGDMATAERLCGDILRAHPDHLGGLFLLAALRMAAGDDEGAARLFVRVLTLEPAIADAQGNLATIRQRQGRLAEAARLFHRAARLAPDNPDWHVGYGMLCLDQPLVAARLFRKALAPSAR